MKHRRSEAWQNIKKNDFTLIIADFQLFAVTLHRTYALLPFLISKNTTANKHIKISETYKK